MSENPCRYRCRPSWSQPASHSANCGPLEQDGLAPRHRSQHSLHWRSSPRQPTSRKAATRCSSGRHPLTSMDRRSLFPGVIEWEVADGAQGAIDSTGHFTSGLPGGPVEVMAKLGDIDGHAEITVRQKTSAHYAYHRANGIRNLFGRQYRTRCCNSRFNSRILIKPRSNGRSSLEREVPSPLEECLKP